MRKHEGKIDTATGGWTPERARRAVDACDRGDLAAQASFAAAIVRKYDVEPLARLHGEYGGLGYGAHRLLLGYSIASVPVLPWVAPPIAPWHPFASAPQVST